MPRLKGRKYPGLGIAWVRTTPCPVCGTEAGDTCYLQCPNSDLAYTADQERADDQATESEIAAVGFKAWDSAQHRRHGLPCPYDGYDPADRDEVYVGLGEIDAGGA
jgi:hypothetical protein